MSIAIEYDEPLKPTKSPKTPKLARVDTIQSAALPYYQFGPALSHNCTYNFIVGGRGLGKTYGAKKLAIRNYIRNGDMFIYLRRYKEELVARDTFFADIQHEFPDWDFRANGNTFEAAPASSRDDRKRAWETMGYAIALSTAQKQKSVAFPRVKLIIFDEFIIEKGMIHYLPDEANVFNNFFSTVDRWKDKTRVLFLANSVSIANPYFLEYKIQPSGNDELLKLHDGFILAHFPNSADFANAVLETKFGKFIQGTEYEKYAIGNQFADNHAELIAPKNPKALFRFNLQTRMGSFSVWHDQLAAQYYALAHTPPGQLEFTLIPEQVKEDRSLAFYTDPMIAQLRTAYRYAKIQFDSPTTRNIFLDVFNRKT